MSATDGILNGGPRENGDRAILLAQPSDWRLDMNSPSLLPGKWSLWRLKHLPAGCSRTCRYLVSGYLDFSPRKSLRSTAYLDGLRGFAAFLVYIHHSQLWVHGAVLHPEIKDGMFLENAFWESGWGWRGEYRFGTLPVVRNFFTGGHASVATFFVISGYVLTMKGVSLVQSGEFLELGDVLASALFRRWFRLWVPILVVTFVQITLWHICGVWNPVAPPKETYALELSDWWREFRAFSFPFKEMIPWLAVNMHLWSISVEMRGSIIVYVALLALSRLTNRARLLAQCVLIVYFLWIIDGWYAALFMSGMLMCDLDLLAKRPDDPRFPGFLRRLEPFRTTLAYAAFVVGMLLAGVPSHSGDVEGLRKNPGWYYLSYLKPGAMRDPKWFFLFWAATMLVFAIPRIHWLKRFFESGFCQYLGQVSYALYLVHGPILATIGDRVYTAVGWVYTDEPRASKLRWWANRLPLPMWGIKGLEISFIIPTIPLLLLTLFVAHIVTRAVDEPAVKYAGKFYKALLDDPAEPKPEDASRLA